MPTITISVTAGQTVGRTKTISGAHLTRMLNAYRTLLGPELTDEEVILAWADGLLAGTRANVRSVENEVAARAAQEAQTDIVLSD